MKLLHVTTSILAAGLMIGCAQAESAAEKAAAKTTETVQKTAEKAAHTTKTAVDGVKKMNRPGVDISAAPSGTYNSEQGHAYVAFSYNHQGYSNPILRWGKMDAVINLDSENPENSTLKVIIPVSSIDSGVEAFDNHLVSADFFDADNHPTITFNSTSMNQAATGTGRVTGDLTIKGVTKQVVLRTTLNKVGKNFRSGVDMFGISAEGKIKRSDFGVDKYGPMADDINIMIEVEFQKAG